MIKKCGHSHTRLFKATLVELPSVNISFLNGIEEQEPVLTGWGSYFKVKEWKKK
jgi:hypothetical protein